MSLPPAKLILSRCAALGDISEEPGVLTRTYGSPAMRHANRLVASWMREAGMSVRTDAIGNLTGRYSGQTPEAKTFLLGSHLDTVRNAGKFDGPLGVLLAIACVQRLYQTKTRLPFALEIIGFADEEGTRYQTAYLGSKVFAGCFDPADLKRKDARGILLSDAIRSFGGDPSKLKSAATIPKNILGYLEAHIEQGPVLQNQNLAVGLVTSIAGQTRGRISFAGTAGHAGTTPMNMRKDALCAAAEFILAAEQFARKIPGLVATVGQIAAEPGASNVIPGDTMLTLDLRHADDSVRRVAYKKLEGVARAIAKSRKIDCKREIIQQSKAVQCSAGLSSKLARAIQRHERKILKLSSGAGHDAVILSQITPVAMLFIRCKDGVSHHPAESVKVEDVKVALDVMTDFLLLLAQDHER